jgi:LysM repeat protein
MGVTLRINRLKEEIPLRLRLFYYVAFQKNIFRLCLFTGLIFLLSGAVSASAQEVSKSNRIEKIDGKKYYIHTVVPGQTLFAIAKAYAIEVADIVKENPGAASGIKPGQDLKIPLSLSVRNTFTPSGKGQTYKAEPGQTLYSIAKLYGVTVEAIKTLNPELRDGLKAGQVIKIPASAEEVKNIPDTKANTEVLKAPEKSIAKEEVKNGSIKEKPAELKESSRVTDLVNPGDTVFVLSKKEKYKVALFLPLHLENTEFPDPDRTTHEQSMLLSKSDMAVQFYQGFRMAMDSMRKLGLNTELFVYDIDENDSVRMQNILKKPELAEMDLFVGPLSNGVFHIIAGYALKHKIQIVSPLSQLNKILLNNDCVSKMTPSSTTLLEEQAAFVARVYPKENIILLGNSNTREIQHVNIFKTRYNEIHGASSSADSLHLVKGIDALSKLLSAGRTNVVIIPSNSQAYVTDVLRSLNTLLEKYKIIVFGMQSWSGFSNLDYDYLNKLSLHYTTSSFVDYENEATLSFVKNFRILASTEPAVYAFQGYDAGYYYLRALFVYGVNFKKKLPKLKWQGLQNSFDFYKTSPGSGLENKAVIYLKIQDYKLVRILPGKEN